MRVAGELQPVCSFSMGVRWLMLEAGIDFKVVVVDLSNKPAWFESETEGWLDASGKYWRWGVDFRQHRYSSSAKR